MATKSPCPKCGEDVTDIPHARQKHVNACTGAQVEEPKMTETSTKKEDKYASDEIKHLVELAKAKEKEYEAAPDAFISEDSTDQHLELRKLYAPETMDKRDEAGKLLEKAPRSAYVADKNKLKLAAQRGYVPVLDGEGNMVVNDGGDVLTTISTERAERMREAPAKESRDRLARHEAQPDNVSTVKGESLPSDVSQITSKVTRTKINSE